MSEGSSTNTALLVQVLDQLGGLREDIGGMKSQLEHGTRRFEAIGNQLDDMELRQATVEELTTGMEKVEPRVKAMEIFLGKKLAPIVAVSSTVVAVALWLIALTIGAAVTWAKANLSDHLHWSEWHVSVIAFICAFLPGYRRTGATPSRKNPMVRDLHDASDGKD